MVDIADAMGVMVGRSRFQRSGHSGYRPEPVARLRPRLVSLTRLQRGTCGHHRTGYGSICGLPFRRLRVAYRRFRGSHLLGMFVRRAQVSAVSCADAAKHFLAPPIAKCGEP